MRRCSSRRNDSDDLVLFVFNRVNDQKQKHIFGPSYGLPSLLAVNVVVEDRQLSPVIED